MGIDEKRQAIIDAVESGKVSGNQLEPVRHGATISKIKAGKPVKDATIEKLYSRLVELLGQEPASQDNKQDNNDNNSDNNKQDNKAESATDNNSDNNKQDNNSDNKGEMATMQQAMAEMRQEMAEMRETIIALQSEVALLKDNNGDNKCNKDNKPDNKQDASRVILGFSLRYQKNTVKGKVYFAWYALKRIAGKLARVYVGDDLSQAESKIRAYCLQKGIAIG